MERDEVGRAGDSASEAEEGEHPGDSAKSEAEEGEHPGEPSKESETHVEVTEERVRVKRRVVDRAATDADAGTFEETVIEVPLWTEEVEVQKQARVAEEVVVDEIRVSREDISTTVRREFAGEEGAAPRVAGNPPTGGEV